MSLIRFHSVLVRLALISVLASTAGFAKGSTADDAPPTPADDGAPPGMVEESAWQAGPRTLELGHDLVIDLPEHYAFLPNPQASKVLEANGVFHNENLLGLIEGDDENARWLFVLRYDEEGYIKDDENPDAKELLESFEEGLPDLNEERREKGFEELTLNGWSEEPRYDRTNHHLVWALNVSSKLGSSVNYNTRVLGRRGYLSMNMVTELTSLDQDKVHASTLLKGTHFKPGAAYADYKDGDKVAEYGLAGLVVGGAGLGAAVKLGLFAKLGKLLLALLIAGKKLVVVAVVGLFGLLKMLFGGKDKTVVSNDTAGSDQQQPPPDQSA